MSTPSSSRTKRLGASLEDVGSSGSESKKKCSNGDQSTTAHHPFLDLLEGDIGSAIFGFLDVKELKKVVFSSKSMMQKLSYEHVIRSGMLHGRYSKTTIERIVENLDSIYIPSPIRLLCLVNGKFCERCGTKKVNHTFGQFGVFMCYSNLGQTCMDEMLETVGHCSEPYRLRGVPRHVLSKTWFLWKAPWLNAGNEPCGPLISLKDIKSLGGDDYEDIKSLGDDHDEAIQKLASDRRAADQSLSTPR